MGIIQAALLLRQGNLGEAEEVIKAAIYELKDILAKARATVGEL